MAESIAVVDIESNGAVVVEGGEKQVEDTKLKHHSHNGSKKVGH